MKNLTVDVVGTETLVPVLGALGDIGNLQSIVKRDIDIIPPLLQVVEVFPEADLDREATLQRQQLHPGVDHTGNIQVMGIRTMDILENTVDVMKMEFQGQEKTIDMIEIGEIDEDPDLGHDRCQENETDHVIENQVDVIGVHLNTAVITRAMV